MGEYFEFRPPNQTGFSAPELFCEISLSRFTRQKKPTHWDWRVCGSCIPDFPWCFRKPPSTLSSSNSSTLAFFACFDTRHSACIEVENSFYASENIWRFLIIFAQVFMISTTPSTYKEHGPPPDQEYKNPHKRRVHFFGV